MYKLNGKFTYACNFYNVPHLNQDVDPEKCCLIAEPYK